MKKVYLAPQTEAIQMFGENAIMAVSGGFQDPSIGWGTGSYNGSGQ